MNSFFISTGLVALAEVGDKTQLLAFVLAARYRKPAPIIGGIFLATLLNHALAVAVGSWLQSLMGPQVLRWVIAGSFLAMAAWTLIPDKLSDGDAPAGRFGVFTTTLFAFFLAEMGDKTQIATVALAAQSGAVLSVLAGTTLGMMIANAPAVLLGERIAHRMPVVWVHRAAAAIFAVLGIATLAGAGSSIGL